MTVKVGIDTIAFYTSHYALDLACLAHARGVNADKFSIGLGQLQMAVIPPDEDIVTMAANAAHQALIGVEKDNIEMLLFATESGVDLSKAAGIYVHDLLDLPKHCRVIELKQACYSATFALQLVMPFLQQHPDKKALLIASDVARYGLNTAGESSQGCGAVAMVLSANPRILALEPEYGVMVENVMDFWRPNYLDNALVDGKYSSKLYLSMLEKTWRQYAAISKRKFADHAYHCYHAPVPRLVEKAHTYLAKIAQAADIAEDSLLQQVQHSLVYGRTIGNSYTASLYIGLASLLDHTPENLANQRVGFYSYGSGCVAEYFSGVLQPDYQKVLHTGYHQARLANRKLLTYPEYEAFYQFVYPTDGSLCEIPSHHTGHFRLTGLYEHKRQYEKLHESISTW